MQPSTFRFIQSRLRSFSYAFRGGRVLLQTQPNAWIHAAATALVVIAGLWSGLSAAEWALLALAAGLVWTAEGLNTALEFLADEVTRERRAGIGRAKDLAAFAVLVAALVAIAVGIAVFLPHLFAGK